jgi:hypothetical protein
MLTAPFAQRSHSKKPPKREAFLIYFFKKAYKKDAPKKAHLLRLEVERFFLLS